MIKTLSPHFESHLLMFSIPEKNHPKEASQQLLGMAGTERPCELLTQKRYGLTNGVPMKL